MKFRLPLLILAIAVFSVQAVCAGEINTQKTGVFYFADFLPQFDTTFDDLDARDENNQPIKTVQAKRDLQAIFTFGLHNLLLYCEIHSVARSLDIIRKKLNLAALAFTKNLPFVAQKVASAILLLTRIRWDKILVCLWGFLAFKIMILLYAFCIQQFALPYIKIAPLYLRC